MTNHNEPCFHDSIFLNEQKYLSIYNLLIKSLVFSTSTMESGKPEPKISGLLERIQLKGCTSLTAKKSSFRRFYEFF